jgi:phospholipid/cholesterol/gamma-HCH transport system ATP-binding protein
VAVGSGERQVVLVLERATLLSDQTEGSEAVTVSMTLHASELAVLHVEPLQWASIFADACSGLVMPAQGSVSFLNQDWARLPADLANALRGRIGRVFAHDPWLSHLSLLDNVVLRQQHHTRRPSAEWREEAVQLATHFGLPGFPAGGHRDLTLEDLRRIACVRAFLGNPTLILLEEPTSTVYPELLVPLIHAIRRARSRGSAVLWLTAAAVIWRDPSIPATARYRLVGRQFMEIARRL